MNGSHPAARPDPAPAPLEDAAAGLVARLGLPVTPDAPSVAGAVAALGELRDALIVAADWPVILRAAELARLGRHRDLVALDADYARAVPPALAEASRHVGRRQLSRLRALRDQRVVQRYLDAVERGQARGWNPVVYGVVLAVFGIPPRQGLLHYAVAILRAHARGFPPAPAAPDAFEDWIAPVEAPLPAALNRLLAPAALLPA
jgi:hypothetical protein